MKQIYYTKEINMFKIYGKMGCKYCEKAIQLCMENNIQFDYVTVGVDITKEKLFEEIGKEVSSVPQIVNFSGGFGEYIGGYAEFKNYLDSTTV